MLSETLIDAFMDGFYGYGDYSARYWFIGLEEGGGGSEDEIERRLNAWDRRGRNELEDLAEFHAAFGEREWFERGALQRTWRGLIRIVLAAEGLDPSIDDLRAYQRERLGRRIGSDTCLIEIMPLPSRNTGAWLYSSITTDHRLLSRKTYDTHVRPQRFRQSQERITKYRPPFVIIYGASRAAFSEPAGTRIVLSRHPTAHGVTNAELAAIGHRLR